MNFPRQKILLIHLLVIFIQHGYLVSSESSATTLNPDDQRAERLVTEAFDEDAQLAKALKEMPDGPFKDTFVKCRLRSTDPYIYNRIREVLDWNVKLVEFNLHFENYTVNPLAVNNTWTYRGTRWARAYSQHGQTLLSLAFNYGIMSLMTLTLGVEDMDVPLVDEPQGCIWKLNEDERVEAVMFLLMRDFQHLETEITLEDQERICHEIIQLTGSKAGKFTDRCCHVSPITRNLQCDTDIINIWLKLLLFVLASVKFALLFFGPVSFIPLIESIAREDYPYVVELNDPLVKTIYLCHSDTHIDRTYEKVLDLRGKRGFPKLRESVKKIPLGEPVKVKFTRYDILVNYKILLMENDVPVGLKSSFIDAIFKCNIRNIGPFVECCATNMFKHLHFIDWETPWIACFKVVAKVMFVILAPLPFYIRVFVFYFYEADEINNRRDHLSSLELPARYEGSLLSFLTPIHPLFIAIYAIYIFTAIVLAGVARGARKEKLGNIIVGSFRDLKHLSYLEALGLLIGNIIWPFDRFGIFGCIIAPFYWIIAVPFTIFLYAFYCLPTIYVAFRMLRHVRTSSPVHHPDGRYKVVKQYDSSMHHFQTENMIKRCTKSDEDDEESVPGAKTKSKEKAYHRINPTLCTNMFLAILCVLTMFGILIAMSEVVGFMVEIGVFTMMGVIVNAGSVLKYVTLLILVVVYSYDTYNNVSKKYLKLNKALFGEVKGRCKNIDKVTSMPSHLQENHGFKSQELSEQAEYEESDGIADGRKSQWMINDLVLFVDNEDMPRIPRKLFEEVCQIRVAGAPGPIHASMIEATQGFLKIMVFIFFVFVVVLTFGQVYRVSSTNQMLAALAGGFLPFIMKTFMAPNKPDIEIGTVSFKSKLDEIIKNFYQNWPIYDLPFEAWTEEDEKAKQEKENEGKEGDKKPETKLEEETGECKDQNANEPLMKETFHDAREFPTSSNVNNNAGTISTPNSTEHQPLIPPTDQFNNGIPPEEFQPPAIGKTEPEEAKHFDVDILVFLPEASNNYTDRWLAEWSDFDEQSQRGDIDLDTISLESYMNSKSKSKLSVASETSPFRNHKSTKNNAV